ncbi:hypothetical protein [cf. Phormidesmis sp. LEGE 11477]|uniref:hypothetical protein n=1 Tax=cf. Phormidesmis sp. LEGE 11477 TaxID=1828680 RepID=UPI00187DED7A|nr:hypothetical protein [cf. Phormidesmis sp. LEGE 11477]MBE9060958.1 hypothetical protein [cf. Phormidesmis sp. LEGE 11477]
MKYPKTPDGRYFVVKGRLWRCTNPNLDEQTRQRHVKVLMKARNQIKQAKRREDLEALSVARAQVNQAKIELGERGSVWWTDGEPDYNRYLAKNTPYADWFSSLTSS